MKLIVINDSDGNTWAVADTPDNRLKVHGFAIEAGLDMEGYELPLGRTFGRVCELVDTDHLATLSKCNPFT